MNTPETSPTVSPCGIWTVYEWLQTSSTNDEGRFLPPWSIARAQHQTKGRGRMNRTWFSDEGGLWVSFVVPLENKEINWAPLPLIAGLSVIDLMDSYGVEGARLRWPNDLLIGRAKLAGILVERCATNKAVIGIGINIANPIAHRQSELKDPVIRVLDLLPSENLSPDDVLEKLASFLHKRFLSFAQRGLDSALLELNAVWKKHPQRVNITLEDQKDQIQGTFYGVDALGNPLLFTDKENEIVVESSMIFRLEEIF